MLKSNLIHLLNEQHMSPSVLAKEAGLDTEKVIEISLAQSITDLQLEDLMKIATVLDVPVEDLFYEPEYQQPEHLKKLAFVQSIMFRLLRTPINTLREATDFSNPNSYGLKFSTLRPAKSVSWRKPTWYNPTGLVEIPHPFSDSKASITYTKKLDFNLLKDVGAWCPFGQVGDIVGAYEPWAISLEDQQKDNRLNVFEHVTQEVNTNYPTVQKFALHPPETMPDQLLRCWLQIAQVDLIAFSDIEELKDDYFHILLEDGFANHAWFDKEKNSWNKKEVFNEFRKLWDAIYTGQRKYQTGRGNDFLLWYIQFKRVV